MRTIKFRGQTKSGKWVYGTPIAYENNDFALLEKPFERYGVEATNILNRTLVEKSTVGQFTGLTDKNGTEIYEGDILEGYKYASAVTFENGAFMWDDDIFLGYSIEAYYEAHHWITADGCNTLEVVGNIYDSSIEEVREKIKEKAKQEQV